MESRQRQGRRHGWSVEAEAEVEAGAGPEVEAQVGV